MIPEELYKLFEYFENSTMGSLDLKMKDFHVKLDKAVQVPVNSPMPVSISTVPETAVSATLEKDKMVSGVEVKAPLVGIFYESASPEAPIFAPLGSKVKKGQVIGLIESMKMFNDLVAPVDGIIESILVSNGELVEYGVPLFIIKEA